MDTLLQTKLCKAEWNSIEIQVSPEEKRILQMIKKGYDNVNTKENFTTNMERFTKLDMTAEMQYTLYIKYFQAGISEIKTKYCADREIWKRAGEFEVGNKKIKKLKSIEALRIQNVDSMISSNKGEILEFILLDFCRSLCKEIKKDIVTFPYYYYTLRHCYKVCNGGTIQNTNNHLLDFVKAILDDTTDLVKPEYIISQSQNILEKNKWLYHFQDIQLFSHQKELFTICRTEQHIPKLILYIAPTGTGKTLSPIGLSEGSRVLFVCVARHVGLALAKSAVSVGKRVAFAFGCTTASDIRLHYFAAIDYEVNRRSGKISKVDNSNGAKVEIMICDMQSYLIAMYYMLSFNPAQNMITYWDEPTITMDYETHALHETINNNWKNNEIPNMVLSCATLPKEHEIQSVLQDFRIKFDGSSVHSIVSSEYRKTIPIVDSNGFSFLPHSHYSDFSELRLVAKYCLENKTLLRYFDLEETVNFIKTVHYVNTKHGTADDLVIPERYLIPNYFTDVMQINMSTLKEYYLILLNQFSEKYWVAIRDLCIKFKKEKYNTIQSKTADDPLKGCRLTTVDSHTLTDGPTIYLTKHVINLAKYCVYQSNIPPSIMDELLKSIEQNNVLQEQIEKMENDLEKAMEVKSNEDTENTSKSKKKVKEKDTTKNTFAEGLEQAIKQLRYQIVPLSLPHEYVPNTSYHQDLWNPNKQAGSQAFQVIVDQSTVKEVMGLKVDTVYKFLVMMGIGVLEKHEDPKYEELVKRLAQEQKLFLILTSSDYIYGTNYQFCHGFIGKDLEGVTQQKLIQSMGRIGRNNIQQTFSVRFRENSFIEQLFREPIRNMEAENMNRLFCSD
jgi:hypothetical protein